MEYLPKEIHELKPKSTVSINRDIIALIYIPSIHDIILDGIEAGGFLSL